MFSFSFPFERRLRNNLKEVIATESIGVNRKYRQFRLRVDVPINDIPFLSSANSNAYSDQLSETSKSNPFQTQTLILSPNVLNTDNESNDNPVLTTFTVATIIIIQTIVSIFRNTGIIIGKDAHARI